MNELNLFVIYGVGIVGIVGLLALYFYISRKETKHKHS
ncbi:MAG: hypothetical protein HW390_2545 [Candidatus Brocadiaceae bacterium]|nr:hypothetical protein [Candidatus Brocadiaceae bacterium]